MARRAPAALKDHARISDSGLRQQLADHHRRFAPCYQGYLSDHGPMAALALLGLGASQDRVRDWLQRYQQRLDPLESAPATYREHLQTLVPRVQRLGSEAVLREELPGLISGWAKEAYHPLIRIAYGLEFQIPEEVAAGLAYLKWREGDTAVAALAAEAQHAQTPQDAFRAMRECATTVTAERTFDDCVARVTARPGFRRAAVVVPDQLNSLSTFALGIFASTHNFFALHLVTGAHAFRVLYAYAGPLRDPIMSLGLLAGYAAVGAPTFELVSPQAELDSPTTLEWLTLISEDEHDIKLAYVASRYSDPAAREVARVYLAETREKRRREPG